jgi:hypothetical protein
MEDYCRVRDRVRTIGRAGSGAVSFYASLKILEKLAKVLGVEPHELIAPPPTPLNLSHWRLTLCYFSLRSRSRIASST